MMHKTNFGFCRKYIVALALLLVLFVSCDGAGELEKADSTDVNTDQTETVTTAVFLPIVENTTSDNENVILEGGDVPLTEEIAVTIAPDVTNEPTDGTKKSGDDEPVISGKTSGATTAVKVTETVTTKHCEDETKNTKTTTTTPLVQVLPDGGLLLPDDEWD